MIPPHRAVALPGLHAYADQLSVEAGGRLTLHVSADLPYRLSVRRLGTDVDDPASDEVLHEASCNEPRVQPIHPGSYVHVAHSLQAADCEALTAECWLHPWDGSGWQAVFSQMDPPPGAGACPGFGLFLDPQGHLVSAWGCNPVGVRVDARHDGLLRSPDPLPRRQWAHVAATWGHEGLALWVNGRCVAQGPARQGNTAIPVQPQPPLRMGACGVNGQADLFLDADIAMPALHRTVLDAAALQARVASAGLEPAQGPQVLACWPLDERSGDTVRDASGHARHGRLLNHGTRLINGPAFDPARVPRYTTHSMDGSPLPDDATRAGLRLAADDLVDCGWAPTHSFTLPADARSGIYVARFDFVQGGQPMDYDVTFVVRRNPGRPPAPLLVLCATNTWLAYSASPFATNQAGAATWPRRCAGLPNSHPLAPAHCTYTYHRAGQPSYHVGLKMPRPHTAASALYAPEGSGFAQWTRLERHLHAWLEQQGYAYDVASDLDLHRQPALLAGYAAVVINGHSEYWSAPACDGLERYLDQGGHLAVLSGNTMYWRVSFNADASVMEQRKTHTPDDPQAGVDPALLAPAGPHGEQYHSQDGARGGLWRFADRSCAHLIGLETAGWGFATGDDFGVYRTRLASHPLFHTPFATGLHNGDRFGHGPGGALPRAVGHEWDLSTRTLLRVTQHWPADARRPEEQPGIEVLAEGVREQPGALDAYLDYFGAPTASLDGLSCEMIHWQRPQGGTVFNAGAVGASWVLGVDGRMGRLLANVLASFGVPYPAAGPYHTPPCKTPS